VVVGLVGPPQPDTPAIGVRNSRQTTAARQKGIAGDIGALRGKRTMMGRAEASVKPRSYARNKRRRAVSIDVRRHHGGT